MTKRKNPNLIFIPNLRYYEVKNPKTLFPVNLEEMYGEDKVRYEEEPEFDELGNYLGMQNNVYVTKSMVVGFKIIKRTKKEEKENKEEIRNLKPKKLF